MLQDIDTKHKAVAGSYGKKVLKSVLGSDTDTSSSEMESKEQNSVQVLQEKVELLEDWVQKQVSTSKPLPHPHLDHFPH